MTPIIVPAYAAVLTLFYAFLSFRVIGMRRSARVSLGAGGNASLERRIRVHGNFGEYVPLALILLGFAELQGRPAWQLHAFCLLLVLGRVAHAYGVAPENADIRFRAAGVLATMLVLIATAVGLLARAAGV
jgi:uncharacterized membrane protein YecN with MAPEG domain